MARLADIPCPVNNLENCSQPEGPHVTRHHLNPRRLCNIAREAQADQSYQDRLFRLVRHPRNKLVVCRCIHNFLDENSNDDLPSEDFIDGKLKAWGDERSR